MLKRKKVTFDTVFNLGRFLYTQAKHGTGQIIPVKKSSKEPQPSTTAIQSVKERLAKEAASPIAVHIPTKPNLLGKFQTF